MHIKELINSQEQLLIPNCQKYSGHIPNNIYLIERKKKLNDLVGSKKMVGRARFVGQSDQLDGFELT